MNEMTVKPSPLYFFHDGSPDNFSIPFILEKFKHKYELKGIFVTQGDSHAPTSFQIVKKMNDLFKSAVPSDLCKSKNRHAFPWEWCSLSLKIDKLKEFENYFPLFFSKLEGEKLFADLLTQEKEDSATLLITGPWSPLKKLFKKNVALIHKIQRIVCMGGALKKGNIFPEVVGGLQRPLSEWNIWVDSESVDWIMRNTSTPLFNRIISLTLLPIDACEDAKITEEFLNKLKEQGESHPLSAITYKIYRLAVDDSMMTIKEPNGTIRKESTYRFWNTLTAFYLIHPELFDQPEVKKIKVCTDVFSPYEGALIMEDKQREIKVLTKVKDLNSFYDKLLNYLKMDQV